MPETQSLESRILSALLRQSGQKAEELARALGCQRADVNRILYGSLKSQVRQDRSYRWHLVQGNSQSAASRPQDVQEQFADTDLASLSRYYLACLGYDETGVSTFLRSSFGDVDYAELAVLPTNSSALSDSEVGRRMLGRKRADRSRFRLFLGYPTSIALVRSRRSDWQGLMVQPIFLFPIEQDRASGRLLLDLTFPIVNQTPLRDLTNGDREGLLNELVQLEHELGIGQDGEEPPLDKMHCVFRE